MNEKNSAETSNARQREPEKLTDEVMHARQETIIKRLKSAGSQLTFLGQALERSICGCTIGLEDLLDGVGTHLLDTQQMLEELWGMDEEEQS